MTMKSELDAEQQADPSDVAAKQAAEDAAKKAREVTRQVALAVSGMDRLRLVYLGSMSMLVVCALVFDMSSFSVGTDNAVSETTAQAQRNVEAKLNSWAESAFSSSLWGKLMWLSAIGGIVTLIYGAVARSSAAWVPLAQMGCAVFATLMMLLLLLVGFPDLSAYSDAESSSTLMGYWVPLVAATTATVCSVGQLLRTG